MVLIKWLSLLFCIVTLTFCKAVPTNKSKSFVLSIIHFSDFHDRFVEVSPGGKLCYDKDECVGGISRVATVVRRLKETRPNPILLNAGDCFQGTLFYELFKGNVTAHFMNKLHPDVHTIGNHDLDDNVSGLVSYLNQMNSPVVATNIDSTDEPSMQNLYSNSTIIRKGDKDIGMIGAIDSDTNKLSKTTGKLKFLNEIETINLEAKKLKERGVDIIIVLSHCGIEHDKLIASNCPDVDVIVGGHSHILLYNGIPPSNDKAYGQYPLVVHQKNSNRKVLIVHPGAFTKYVGDLIVNFDKIGEVSSWKGNPIYLKQSIPQDTSFIQELQPWKNSVDRIGKRILASSSVFLNNSCFTGDCALGNLITDAMVDTYSQEASLSFLPAFYMQNSIPDGPVRYEDINMMLPMTKPTWHLIELKGIDLLKVLEYNADIYANNTSMKNREFLLWSGLQVTYDLQNKKSKVVSVNVRCRSCKDERFEELNDEEWYRIVISNNIVYKEFFKIYFANHRVITTGTIHDIENLANYLEKKKTINATTESRITFVHH